MQKLRKTKGFTLTELAIVIAVIAILTAVLVPTFTSLINKANESADEQAVANMNTALATDEALNGKPEDVGEAADVLEAYGFSTSFETYTSGYMLKWDSSQNLVLLYNTDTQEVVYPTSYGTTLASTGVYSLTTVVDSSDPTAGFAGGSGTEDDPYLITSTNGLESLRTLIALNNTSSSASTNISLASTKVTTEDQTESKYQISVKLLRDIDLGTNWTPLGTVDYTYVQNSGSATINSDDCNPFIGEFDGNSKTITINNPTSKLDYALFSYVSGTESNPTYIHDINFVMNVTNDTAYECSAVAAAIDGNGINSVIIENITVYGEIKAECHAGGVVGWYARGCSFINCSNYANITTTRTSSYSAIGGIAAQAGNYENDSSWSYDVTFIDCKNYGNLTHSVAETTYSTYSQIGHIVGQVVNKGSSNSEYHGTLTFTNCSYDENATITGYGKDYSIETTNGTYLFEGYDTKTSSYTYTTANTCKLLIGGYVSYYVIIDDTTYTFTSTNSYFTTTSTDE